MIWKNGNTKVHSETSSLKSSIIRNTSSDSRTVFILKVFICSENENCIRQVRFGSSDGWTQYYQFGCAKRSTWLVPSNAKYDWRFRFVVWNIVPEFGRILGMRRKSCFELEKSRIHHFVWPTASMTPHNSMWNVESVYRNCPHSNSFAVDFCFGYSMFHRPHQKMCLSISPKVSF